LPLNCSQCQRFLLRLDLGSEFDTIFQTAEVSLKEEAEKRLAPFYSKLAHAEQSLVLAEVRLITFSLTFFYPIFSTFPLQQAKAKAEIEEYREAISEKRRARQTAEESFFFLTTPFFSLSTSFLSFQDFSGPMRSGMKRFPLWPSVLRPSVWTYNRWKLPARSG
jgi:hypothetical protein